MASSARKRRADKSRIVGRFLQDARGGTMRSEVEMSAGISSGYLCRLESGRRQPSVEVFIAICKALRIAPDALIRKISAALD